MKKIMLFALTMGMVASCNMEPGDPGKEGSSKELAKEAKKNCLLTEFNFKLGESERSFTYKYNGDTLVNLDILIKDKEEQQTLEYQYDEKGRIKKIAYPEGKSSEYVYDDEGRMIETIENGNLMPRKFEYNEQGKIIKQITLWGEKPYYVYEYSYDQKGNPTGLKSYNNKGELDKSMSIEYDDNTNPVKGKGPMSNSLELFYGFPVGNADNNVTKIITTYQKKTNYKINGEYKEAGDMDTTLYSYVYNEAGYPTRIFAANTDTVDLKYSCK